MGAGQVAWASPRLGPWFSDQHSRGDQVLVAQGLGALTFDGRMDVGGDSFRWSDGIPETGSTGVVLESFGEMVNVAGSVEGVELRLSRAGESRECIVISDFGGDYEVLVGSGVRQSLKPCLLGDPSDWELIDKVLPVIGTAPFAGIAAPTEVARIDESAEVGLLAHSGEELYVLRADASIGMYRRGRGEPAERLGPDRVTLVHDAWRMGPPGTGRFLMFLSHGNVAPGHFLVVTLGADSVLAERQVLVAADV